MTQTSLGLSDAEFLEKDPAELLAEEAAPDTEELADQEIEPSDQTDGDKVATSEEEVSEAQEQTESETVTEEVSQPEGDTQTEPENSTDSDTTESLDTSKKDSTDTKGDTPETTEFDYESAYKKVSEPFKANGVDMQVKDPEDIVRLMQMGANYQKKMAQLKPNLKLIKMLEKNELLDEAKLHNLIDLSKKDPKAIAKLVQESDVDPLDIDKDVPTDYQPTNYTVTDKEYNLDAILDEIKDTDTFNRTINVMTKEWDVQSKSTISENPEIISIVNTHMGNGVFDKVNAMLQQEKALGKLAGIPDVEAYRQIAESMHKNGFLQAQNGNKPGTSEVSSKTDEKANADRDKKRKAVAPVKQTTTKKASTDDNFLGLSDDEFMKKYAVR
ncbi:MAG TPA: hypothetical protein EYP94_03750 [Gammaproteobacteria bacterium]|jgi:hypothetical protein|nr:hypothetical protein [Gammaproteobacteria bacterium]